MTCGLCKRDAEIATLRQERGELLRTFDLMWDADRRAIQRWQAAAPQGEDRTLTWPDRSQLTEWLLQERDAARAEVERLNSLLDECRRLLALGATSPGADELAELIHPITGDRVYVSERTGRILRTEPPPSADYKNHGRQWVTDSIAAALATAREQGKVKGRAEGARQMRERALTALPENYKFSDYQELQNAAKMAVARLRDAIRALPEDEK